MTENIEVKTKNRAACGHLKRVVMPFFEKILKPPLLVIIYGLSGMYSGFSGNTEAALVWIITLILVFVIEKQDQVDKARKQYEELLLKRIEMLEA